METLIYMDEAGKYDRDALEKLIAPFTDDKEKAKEIQDQLNSCFDENGSNDGDDIASLLERVDVVIECLKEIKE